MDWSVVAAVLLLALILALLLGFTVRVVGGVFSAKIRKKIRAHPFLHSPWFLLCLAIIYLVISEGFLRQPLEDADMEDHFHEHKLELTNLVTMLREDDKIEFLTDSFIHPERIVEEKRWGQYRNLMASIGVRSISAYWGPTPKITFRLNGGAYFGSFQKGYVYSTREPGPIRDNLDRSRNDLPPLRTPGFTKRFRAIGVFILKTKAIDKYRGI